MSNGALELRNGAAPARIGQATAIEQSRAVAEVQAQVVVAQQMPRSVDRAILDMQRSCARKSLAEKAFYRYKRGTSQVSGETIVLAKELARCWGNIDYGLAELRRDDYAGESEMMAFAWDLQTNTRPRTTFIVPHIRDKKGGGERLTETRDVYELNANMGNRRMREMIFNVLPPWFIEEAKTLCYATLGADDSDGKTLAERSGAAVGRFAKIGVRAEQLSQKLGAPQAAWSAADLATLAVIFRSIERGETTKEDEFGATTATISPSDLAPPKNASPAGTETAPHSAPSAVPSADVPPAGEAHRKPQQASDGQVTTLRMHLERLGYEGDRAGRLRATIRLANLEHGDLSTSSDLTREQAATAIRRVKDLREATELAALLDELDGDPRDQNGVPGE